MAVLEAAVAVGAARTRVNDWHLSRLGARHRAFGSEHDGRICMSAGYLQELFSQHFWGRLRSFGGPEGSGIWVMSLFIPSFRIWVSQCIFLSISLSFSPTLPLCHPEIIFREAWKIHEKGFTVHITRRARCLRMHFWHIFPLLGETLLDERRRTVCSSMDCGLLYTDGQRASEWYCFIYFCPLFGKCVPL
jgi:hypothetical protein